MDNYIANIPNFQSLGAENQYTWTDQGAWSCIESPLRGKETEKNRPWVKQYRQSCPANKWAQKN